MAKNERGFPIGNTLLGVGTSLAISYWLYTIQGSEHLSFWRWPGFLALAISAVGLTLIVLTFSQREKEETHLIDDVNWERAKLISAWTEISKTEDATGKAIFGLVANAKNGSNEPIFDVTCTWGVKDVNDSNYYSVAIVHTGLIPPNTPYFWHLDRDKFLECIHSDGHKLPSLENALEVVRRSRVAIVFTDAERQKWVRTLEGQLSRVE